jgi:hypothetical protein
VRAAQLLIQYRFGDPYAVVEQNELAQLLQTALDDILWTRRSP